jgi:hypothetical protein
MKTLSIVIVMMLFNSSLLFSQVSINTDGSPPDNSSVLDVKSTTKGMLIPRMTQTERDAITSPANGLLIFCTSNNQYYANKGTSSAPNWMIISSHWISSNQDIYFNLGNVGLGTTTPGRQLELTQSIKIPATTSSSTGIIFKGDIPFLHDYKGPIALGFNTFLGQDAGNFTMGGGGNYHGCNNTGLGFNALHGVTSGYANTGVGSFSLSSTTVGIENTAVGLHSLIANTIGNRNTALGYMAGHDNVEGGNNTLIGYNANYFNQGGGNNTIIGYEAGKGSALHNKNGNIFLGCQAGFYETGSNKLYIENSNSSSPLIGGDFSLNEVYLNGKLGIGTSAPSASLHIAGTMRLVDGTQATGRILKATADGTASWADPSTISDGDWTISGSDMYSAVSGNIGIGTTTPEQQLELTQSLKLAPTTSTSTGIIFKDDVWFIHDYKGPVALGFNTFIGQFAGNFTSGGGQNYMGCNNTGTGYNTLRSVSTGYANTATGSYAMPSNTNGYENTAMGIQSLYSNLGGIRNVGIGVYALFNNTSGSQNTALGMGANYYNQTGTNNTIIGYEAGKGTALHNKFGNIFLGYQAGFNETGSNKLYIENSSSSTPLIGGDFSTDIAYVNGKLGIGTTAPGQQLEITQSLKLPNTNTSTTGVIYKDSQPFLHDYTPPPQIGRNLFLGQNAGNFTCGGPDFSDGTANIGVGENALLDLSSGENNVAVGIYTLESVTTGSRNTAVGNSSMLLTSSGSFNTAFGAWALVNPMHSDYNTAVGYYAGQQNQSLSHCGSFGYDARPTASNMIHIGNTAVTWIGGMVGWGTFSDARVKQDIREDIPGLDFVLALRPVTYHYDVDRLDELMGIKKQTEELDCMKQAKADQEKIIYSGFLAQEVEQAAQKCGYDFSGVKAPVNENTPYSLVYAEFVVPLVKAVQEQQKLIEELQNKVKELEARE